MKDLYSSNYTAQDFKREEFKYSDKMQEMVDNYDGEHNMKQNPISKYVEAYLKTKATLRNSAK